MSRKLASRVFLVALVLPLLNCGGEHKPDEIYYLVSANTKLPYWQTAASGLLKAAAQLNVKATGRPQPAVTEERTVLSGSGLVPSRSTATPGLTLDGFVTPPCEKLIVAKGLWPPQTPAWTKK